ncbi:MAG: hypothetical protein Q9166_005645 [cf. Caloplaca sp. 2 TL-2023]
MSVPDAEYLENHCYGCYNIVGLGTCGTVFDILGTHHVLKKGVDVPALQNDFDLTKTVHRAIDDIRDLLQQAFPHNTIPAVPCCSMFRHPSSTYWGKNLQRFPASHRVEGAGFLLDRIPAIPKVVREVLIDRYFDKKIRKEAKNNKGNEACLVRVYLGEKESDQPHDSLRNFPLRLNMVQELNLDEGVLADEMAIALAVLHWQAQVDAMDTEFVLGSARASPSAGRRLHVAANGPHDVNETDPTMRPIHMWILDFDKSSPIELIPGDVDRLVTAFLGNDPYYPRPDISAELWARFRSTYLKASRLILHNRHVSSQAMKLPRLFTEKVVAKIEEHKDWKVVFE